MASRTVRLLVAATAASVLLGPLTACNPAGPSAGPATSSAAPTVTVTASPTATRAAATSPNCDPASHGTHRLNPAANHKVVYPAKRNDHNTLQAQDATFVCDADGGHYEGNGPVRMYSLAKNLQVWISAGPGADVDGGRGDDPVTGGAFDSLSLRISDCMNGSGKFCAKYNAWEMGQDADGKVDSMKQINP